METLILSARYEPIARVTWQRAITLLWQEKVEVVEEYDDREIRAVSVSIPMPSVIRFIRAIARRRRVIKFSRENVFLRDDGRCQYCGRRIPRETATYDHVVPRKLGGPTTWDNIVCACVDCNVRKGGRTPRQANMTLIRRPEKPRRSPLLNLKLTQKKYHSWQSFLDNAYWNVELK